MGSCGGSKNAASMKNESLVEMTISQQMAEDRPATRAWGEGTNFNQSFAKTYAETQARAAFARMLSSKVTTASRQANDAAQQYSSDGKKASRPTIKAPHPTLSPSRSQTVLCLDL